MAAIALICYSTYYAKNYLSSIKSYLAISYISIYYYLLAFTIYYLLAITYYLLTIIY